MSTRPNAAEQAAHNEVLEKLDFIPTYRDAGLSVRFAKLVLDRQILKDKIGEMEDQCSKLTDELMLDMASSDLKSVLVDNYQVTLIESTRQKLDKGKLLELGVDPEIILAATTESQSVYLQIRNTEKEDTGRRERKQGVLPIRSSAKSGGKSKVAKKAAKSKGKKRTTGGPRGRI